MKNLFAEFPRITNGDVIIRKMIDSDLDSLFDICSNDNVYKYSPTFLYTKSQTTLKNAIEHLGGRDFEKKKHIIAGICLPDNSEKIVGTAEMFDYEKKVNMITIGYKINENFWGRCIATKTVSAMVDYLFNQIGMNRIQAFVMPENIKSQNVLMKNGFLKEGIIRQGHVWKGKGVVDLVLFSLLRSDYIV